MTYALIQRLIVVRHAESKIGENATLSDEGRRQAHYLKEQLAPFTQNNLTTILNSPAVRASQTSRIIGRDLLTAPVEAGCLWKDENHVGNLVQSMQLIELCTTPVVIVVTHYDWTHSIPQAFAQTVLQSTIPLGELRGYGEAWHIMVADKTATKIMQPI